jgi:hypothetical protein
MGKEGTDVAREAADGIIHLFGQLVFAIEAANSCRSLLFR